MTTIGGLPGAGYRHGSTAAYARHGLKVRAFGPDIVASYGCAPLDEVVYILSRRDRARQMKDDHLDLAGPHVLYHCGKAVAAGLSLACHTQ